MYDDPDASQNEDLRTRQNYVEAVTGATFSVKVILSDTFEMGHCDAARINISFDGAERGWYLDVRLKTEESALAGPASRFLEDNTVPRRLRAMEIGQALLWGISYE